MGFLFKAMATTTVFHVLEDESEISLEVFINKDHLIYLQVGLLENQHHEYKGSIVMNKEDALALAEELKRLADQL